MAKDINASQLPCFLVSISVANKTLFFLKRMARFTFFKTSLSYVQDETNTVCLRYLIFLVIFHLAIIFLDKTWEITNTLVAMVPVIRGYIHIS